MACACLRSLAVGLALDGSPELVSVVSDEYFNERMNDVEQILLCVCAAASSIEPNFQNSNSCFSRGIRCDGVRPFHWQERIQMQSRKRAQARWQIPALCARTAPQQMSSTGQLSSATLPHQNLATLRNWASGRSMSRPVPATSWPEPGARRAPRRTSDISQPVRLT